VILPLELQDVAQRIGVTIVEFVMEQMLVQRVNKNAEMAGNAIS